MGFLPSTVSFHNKKRSECPFPSRQQLAQEQRKWRCTQSLVKTDGWFQFFKFYISLFGEDFLFDSYFFRWVETTNSKTFELIRVWSLRRRDFSSLRIYKDPPNGRVNEPAVRRGVFGSSNSSLLRGQDS